MSALIFAAGTVLIRDNEVLLVHRPRYDDWSFPKGKVDGAELLPLTAIRECDEETGFLPVLGPHLGVDRYDTPEGEKAVHYWRARVRENLGFAPDEEVDKVAWIPIDHVAEHLTYSQDLQFLQRAIALPPTSPLIILRHAKAVKRSDFTGKDDGERPLSGRGRRQSKTITDVLEGYGLHVGVRVVPLTILPNVRVAFELSPFARANFKSGIFYSYLGVAYQFNKK